MQRQKSLEAFRDGEAMARAVGRMIWGEFREGQEPGHVGPWRPRLEFGFYSESKDQSGAVT